MTPETRYQILKQIQGKPDVTQRELAESLGMSLGKVNYCLNALVERGMVKVGNFTRNEKKMRYAYLLTPKGISEKARVTVRFLEQKQQEYELLKQQLEQLRREADEL